jgi:hypothetical protein
MIQDKKTIDFFRKIAEQQFVLLVCNDYGVDRGRLVQFTDTISNIYKYLQYHTFNSVIIYIALDEDKKLSKLNGVNITTYLSYENITTLSGKHIVVEIKSNGDLDISMEYDIDIEMLRENAVIYKFDKANENELIYGKTNAIRLEPIPDSDSYFAIQSYKTLELALEDYKAKVAKHSDCPYLKKAWFDENMLFFRKGPEYLLRDSLTSFLKMRLRNVEVRPEQVVDKSHPVDIKVSWALINRLALIEIKWLGKSLVHRNKQFTKKFYASRALSGAKQLADYLDANMIQAPNYASKGYLVIFDGRRAGCNQGTILQLNAVNALNHINDEIIYSPDYSLTRTDFSKPYRFFMQPKYTTT